MDWKTFIASIVGSLAWPGLLAFIFIKYKDQMVQLRYALKTLKAGSFEFDFTKEVKGLKEVDQITLSSKDQEIFKSDIPTKYMITESWSLLEESINSCAIKKGIIIDSNILKTVNMLNQHHIINNKDNYLISKLRELKNEAEHSINFNPEIGAALEYKDLVNNLLKKLN